MSRVLEVGITSARPISVLDVSLAFTDFLCGGETSASLTVQPDMVQGM